MEQKNRMWVLVNKWNEGDYFDFAKDGWVTQFSLNCLLPSENVAENIIAESFGEQTGVLWVDIEKITEEGTIVYVMQEHDFD